MRVKVPPRRGRVSAPARIMRKRPDSRDDVGIVPYKRGSLTFSVGADALIRPYRAEAS